MCIRDRSPAAVGYTAVPLLDASCGWDDTPTKDMRSGLSESGRQIYGHLTREVLDTVPGGVAHEPRQLIASHPTGSSCPWTASSGHTRRSSKDSRNAAPVHVPKPPPVSFQQDVHLWPDLAPPSKPASGASSPASFKASPAQSPSVVSKQVPMPQQDARLLDAPAVPLDTPAPPVSEPKGSSSSWAALASGKKVQQPKPAPPPGPVKPTNAWASGRPSSLVSTTQAPATQPGHEGMPGARWVVRLAAHRSGQGGTMEPAQGLVHVSAVIRGITRVSVMPVKGKQGVASLRSRGGTPKRRTTRKDLVRSVGTGLRLKLQKEARELEQSDGTA
eukprot:TRINITY_DN12957_c0_g1_i2.p2 TRINITY_DN12957_c0_g1~~TRINITY_DN12957_c0_g1_i2.p2  ORF type:complete len:331 (+),score=25.38 TRINITY_DN12957_c0_g1_i2:141-1133(+)